MFSKLKKLFSGDTVADKRAAVAGASSGPETSVGEALALKQAGDDFFNQQALDEAEASYQASLALDANQPEIYKNLGVISYYRKAYPAALEYYNEALRLHPDFPEAYSNRALIWYDSQEYDAALADLDQAVRLKPNFAAAYNNRGLVLMDMEQVSDALQSFDRAIQINPKYAQAYKNRGDVYAHLQEPELAIRDHEHALKIDPEVNMDLGLFMDRKSVLCDWRGYDQYLGMLYAAIEARKVIQPITVLWHTHSAALKRIAAEVYVAYTIANYTGAELAPPLPALPKHKKIRLAYVCGEFYQHAIVFLTAELFEKHDKDQFELYAISLTAFQDHATERLKQSFDQFIDASAMSDEEVLSLVRALEIDIAIDLNGITGHWNPALFAMRIAPVQVNYLGYPGTIGVDFMDYILADEVVIPPSHQQYYSEKVAYLPSFQMNDRKRRVSDKAMTRAELDLPDNGFVYCCFNNHSKITPHMYDIWMRILQQVNGSVLWLLSGSEAANKNLIKEAEARGVDGSRLIFAGKMPYDEHLARYRLADLFLDNLPFNAGTTASDAMWAGLPVLTQVGEAFSSRMGASLLKAIDMPELITDSPAAYESLAVQLGNHPEQMKQLKQKLADNRLTTLLFDSEACARNIESLYQQMYARYHAGLAPDHLYITPVKQV